MSTKITKPFNALKSTLSADWDTAKGVFEQTKGLFKDAWAGQNGGLMGLGTGLGNLFDQTFTKMASQPGGAWGAAGRMGAYGAGGVAATTAAADLVNPWGLGWGDS